MMTTFSRTRRLAFALMAGTVMGGTALVPGIAAAQSQNGARAYDIPAGSLTDALNRFAEQSGIQLTYEAALTQDRTTSGLRGSLRRVTPSRSCCRARALPLAHQARVR
ncbi:hypothetical protein [Novosphingobium sp. 9]|uniref:hypothetical protein n=1 Tax=Novosphingobium sp. 9 TaxID=2025349 RepID=UPI0021B5122D|nr:hypothetical protein [Novosphingobium sp. 9]